MSNNRGQAFSSEMLVAFSIFIACLILVLALWNNSTRDILVGENRKKLVDAGTAAAEKLVRTPGSPKGWNETFVTSLGLVNDSRVLVSGKVGAFVHMMDDNQNDLCQAGIPNYECNAYRLGMGSYQFLFNMTYLNDSVVVIDGTPAVTGRFWDNHTDSLSIMRTALLDDSIVRIKLTVWR